MYLIERYINICVRYFTDIYRNFKLKNYLNSVCK